tara:strand:- start:241 stop:840 length:600 start_codon:yes stop_codon:yes gene_type:complete
MFYIFPRAIAPDACDEIIKDCKQNILEDALVGDYGHVAGDSKYSRDDPNLRKTSISFITDKDNKINELVWGFLRRANEIQFHYDLKYFQAIQFAEYENGGFFDWHQDDAGRSEINERRKLSLSFILSDPDTFEGGELQFYNGGRPMQAMGEITGEKVKDDIQTQGTVVVFDSNDWHRITPVTKGVRHSIVCWTVGPNFK